jgi:hypothetical protein
MDYGNESIPAAKISWSVIRGLANQKVIVRKRIYL